MSLCVLSQDARLMPTAGCLPTVPDMPPAPPTVEASTAATSTSATPALSPPPIVAIQKVTPTAIEVVVPTT